VYCAMWVDIRARAGVAMQRKEVSRENGAVRVAWDLRLQPRPRGCRRNLVGAVVDGIVMNVDGVELSWTTRLAAVSLEKLRLELRPSPRKSKILYLNALLPCCLHARASRR
jgi:hypothetical protein